jgi:neutral ceramidase
VCVSNPAEYFVENGLRIKKDSGFPMTFPTELANGCTGYVPTEKAFGPHGGGYETRLTYYSNLEVTAGTQMADVGIELSKQLTPDKMPEPAKASPFTRPWTYGAVPPQVK